MSAWSEEDLLALIGSIYDASLDPPLWDCFLESLRALLGAEAAAIVRHSRENPGGVVFASSGIDPAYRRAYAERFNRLNVWTGSRIEDPVPDVARTSEMLCPKDDLVRSEFYQGFLKPQNIFHSVAACVKVDPVSVPFCAVFGSRLRGEFDERDMGLLRLLTPHMRRAFQMQERAVAMDATSGAALAALDALPIGCVLADKFARVLLANGTAERIFNSRDGLAVSGGVLGAARQEHTAALRLLVYQAGMTGNGNGIEPGGAILIERPSGRAPLQILVTPFRGGENWSGERPSAMLFIADPECEAQPDGRVLGAIFGLTPAESRVAAQLHNGRSIEQCAEALHISRHTARNHLKSIFLKTGTSRQGELVRVLLTSVARLRTAR